METQNSRTCLYQKDGCKSFESIQSGVSKIGNDIQSYKRRFWMLFLFSFLSMLCGSVFPQYAVMTDVNMCFYGVSAEAVNWTCLIFMVVYIVLVFPVSWMMGKLGLRTTIILGALFNTLSYAVQFTTLKPGNFIYVMLVAFLGAISDVLVLAIPPCLAAVWFPSKEISRACAMGVFGNQLGVAIGFVISPLMISSDCENTESIAEGKRNVAILMTSINAAVLLLIVLTFQKEPKKPPSIAQAEKKDAEESYLKSSLIMAKNINFMLVFVMYGLLVGTYFAIATLLNSLVLNYFPSANVEVGWMGLLLVVTGLVGSIIAGYILDFTHRFKETTISICVLSFLAYIVFSCVLEINKISLQFVTIGILGFFLTSFLPVGFEYAIEVTYPESEIISASLLNSSTMLFGIIITMVGSYILQNFGPMYANVTLGVALLMGAIISCFITKNYKRSKKNEIKFTTKL